MTVYVAYYASEKGPWRVRIIARSFACKTEELPTEIKTYCHAYRVYKIEAYSCRAGARATVDHCLSGNWIEDTERPN